MKNTKMNKKKIYLDVAKLHKVSIKSGFLSTLGVRFLALMYRCIDEAEFSTLIVEYDNDEIKGFVSGTLGTESLYKKMLKHPLQLTMALSPIIFSISKFKKVINILKHMSGSNRLKYPKPELLSICVGNKYQRQGVAAKLYKNLSLFFKSESIDQFVIIVGQSLDANKFYIKQGGIISGVLEVHPGVKSNIYIQKI